MAEGVFFCSVFSSLLLSFSAPPSTTLDIASGVFLYFLAPSSWGMATNFPLCTSQVSHPLSFWAMDSCNCRWTHMPGRSYAGDQLNMPLAWVCQENPKMLCSQCLAHSRTFFQDDVVHVLPHWRASSPWFSPLIWALIFTWNLLWVCFQIRDISAWIFLFFFLICSEFCHTLKWNGLEFTCLPHPDPPSHLPLHPLPPRLQSEVSQKDTAWIFQ